jgi:hypothetical protein
MEILLLALAMAIPAIGGVIASKTEKATAETPKKDSQEISDELAVVISLAAHEIIKKPIKVKAIHFLDTPEDTAWAMNGRFNIMNSHRH